MILGQFELEPVGHEGCSGLPWGTRQRRSRKKGRAFGFCLQADLVEEAHDDVAQIKEKSEKLLGGYWLTPVR